MKKYFNDLNYTFNNEDSELEVNILRENERKIVVVAGGGGRVVSLFYKNPKEVNIFDVSEEQLFLTELKIKTVECLDYNEYSYFWNFFNVRQKNRKRKELFEKIILSKEAKKYLLLMFENNNWNSILYIGKWEKTFLKITKMNNFITNNKILPFFEYVKKNDRLRFLKKDFPWMRFKFSLWILGRGMVFNKMLYGGKFPKNTLNISNYRFYLKAFTEMFYSNKENFFLEFLFFGRMKKNLPFEFRKENFSKIKKGIKNSKINYLNCSLDDIVGKIININFISMSDIISYYSDNRAENFLKNIENNIVLNGIIINRNYLNVPEIKLSNFKNVTEKFKLEIEKEKTQMYKIKIYQKK